MQMLYRFLKDESGATAIEYGLIAALVSVVIITAVATRGRQPRPDVHRDQRLPRSPALSAKRRCPDVDSPLDPPGWAGNRAGRFASFLAPRNEPARHC